MTSLLVQLLRMVQTPEEEIVTLVSLANQTEPPLELIRELCLLQLDVISEVSQFRTWECFQANRSKIVALWRKYMDGPVKETKQTETKAIELSPNTSAASSSTPTRVSRTSRRLLNLTSASSSKATSPGQRQIEATARPALAISSVPVLTPVPGPVSKYASIKLYYQLFRKVATPEWIVDSLLAEDANHSPVLMSRLSDLEKEVATLPLRSSEPVLANYRTQVVALWSEYYPQPPTTVAIQQPKIALTTQQETPKKAQMTAFEQQQPSQQQQSEPKPAINGNSGYSQVNSGGGGHNFTKAGTCAMIAKNFAHIREITSVQQVEELKELANQVAKSIKTIGPFKKDDSVQERAVGLILPKLPAQLQADFKDRVERNIYSLNLRNLKLFLGEAMATIYSQRRTPEVGSGGNQGAQEEIAPNMVHHQQQQPLHQQQQVLNVQGVVAPSAFSFATPYKATSFSYPSETMQGVEAPKNCRTCKKEGHEFATCPERNTPMCYKCGTSGHIARYCRVPASGVGAQQLSHTQSSSSSSQPQLSHQARLTEILSRLGTLFEPIYHKPPEEIDHRKLVVLLERADSVSQSMWRNEEVQKFALSRVLPKLGASMRDRFLNRCRNSDRPLTIRELKSFLNYELRNTQHVIAPSDLLSTINGRFGRGANTTGSSVSGASSEPSEVGGLDWCTKCSTKGHRAELCVDVMSMLDLGSSF